MMVTIDNGNRIFCTQIPIVSSVHMNDSKVPRMHLMFTRPERAAHWYAVPRALVTEHIRLPHSPQRRRSLSRVRLVELMLLDTDIDGIPQDSSYCRFSPYHIFKIPSLVNRRLKTFVLSLAVDGFMP